MTKDYKSNLQDYYNEDCFANAVKNVSAIEKLDGATIEAYAAYFQRVLYVVRLEATGELYIYNYTRGCYEYFHTWLMQGLFKHLLNRAGNPWRAAYETEILGAYKRSVSKTVKGFDLSNEMNFRNGVVDLDSGTFKPHGPETTFFKTVLEYDYDEKAACPLFERFIRETACNDSELISVLQEMFGYCCSVLTEADKAFFCYGYGANGKSLLGRVMTAVIGPGFTSGVSLEALDQPFTLSSLVGKRLNLAGENEHMPNSETLKKLASGDSQNVQIKYRDSIEYRFFTKNVFLMNNLPKTSDKSHGYFRKIMVIPFKYTIPPEKMDRDLYNKLLAERSGIFNWAYAGYRRLVANDFHFSDCTAVNQATAEYYNRENPVPIFFHATYIAAKGKKIARTCLYLDYQKWAMENDLDILDRQRFFSALKAVAEDQNSGINFSVKKSGNERYLVGYTYRSNEQEGGENRHES